jgi:hypothetical protein
VQSSVYFLLWHLTLVLRLSEGLGVAARLSERTLDSGKLSLP